MNPDILRNSYDTFAPRYEEVFLDQQRPKIEALLARVPPLTPALDLGCGTGLARRISGRPFVGLDISRGMLTHAQGPRVQAELTQAPFRAGAFRLVLSVTALIDYADARPAVAEIRRLLAPEGWLALSVLKREDIVGLEAALERAGLPVLERLDLEQDFGFIARKS